MRGRAVQDLTGTAFGRLTVLEHAGRNPNRVSLWKCRCECGVVKTVPRTRLRTGETSSCGCLDKERRTTHGHCKPYTGVYRSWQAMLARCSNNSRENFGNYGGRGICVCERWKSFESFLEDMGTKPTAKHSLDRIDSNGNYEKSNCRWATWTEQARNRSNNHWIEFRGERKLITVWAVELGIKPHVVYARATRGVTDPEKLLSKPRAYRGKRSLSC